jgi:ribosome-associated toxin RatA of RatAB toxin-antitoxin module
MDRRWRSSLPHSDDITELGSLEQPGKVTAMAVKESREFVIEASPDEILDVIADVESNPEWSPQQQSVEVLDRHKDGRPNQVKMKVKTAGISDEQVVAYTWADNAVTWTLVKAGQLRAQDAGYTLLSDGEKTRVKFDLAIDPSVPLPGFILKRAIRGAMETATDGLRKRVLNVKKGR